MSKLSIDSTSADNLRTALMREDLLDRRWTRRRDQLLPLAGLIAVVASRLTGKPELAGAGLLPAAPRATRWLVDVAPNRRRSHGAANNSG